MKNLKLLLLSTVMLFSSQVLAMEESQKDLDQKLFQAIENEDLNQVKAAIEAGAKVNSFDKFGFTALTRAAQFYPEAIELLIKSGADVNAMNKSGYTALMWASCKQSISVKRLIYYCASNGIKLDVNFKNDYSDVPSYNGNPLESSLSFAVKYQPEAILYLVLAGADLNQILEDDYPTKYQKMLHIQNKVKELFNLFKDYKNNRDQILTEINCYGQESDLLKILKDFNGNTLLHYAVLNNDKRMVVILLGYCPSLAVIKNNNGIAPVELAAGLGKEKIFKYLVNQAFAQ